MNATAVDAPALPDRATMHPYDAQMSTLKNAFLKDYTPSELMTMRTAYWGAVGEAMLIVDDVLEAARASGHLNNTVVIYTSDHGAFLRALPARRALATLTPSPTPFIAGEMSMEHRMDYKNSLREPSVRVPLIIAPFNVPGLSAAAGATVTQLTSHIDILPTIMDLAGAPTPREARGQSLVPLMRPAGAAGAAPPAPRRDYVCAEYHSNLGSTGSYMIRSAQWKLITFGHTFAWFNASAYIPQLFDVDADPLETTNVAAQNPSVVASLFAALEAEFGGAGAIAKIDAAQFAQNFALFEDGWGNFTPAALEAAFEKTYRNVTGGAPAIMQRVDAWIAASRALAARGV